MTSVVIPPTPRHALIARGLRAIHQRPHEPSQDIVDPKRYMTSSFQDVVKYHCRRVERIRHILAEGERLMNNPTVESAPKASSSFKSTPSS